MQIQKKGYLSLEQMTDQYLANGKVRSSEKSAAGTSFRDILEKHQPDKALKFSKHAAGRLQQRGIELSEEQMTRLNEGAEKASLKGIKESLVMIDSLAFIVNVPSQTVVTAMDHTESNENIFTNIDGAVIN